MNSGNYDLDIIKDSIPEKYLTKIKCNWNCTVTSIFCLLNNISNICENQPALNLINGQAWFDEDWIQCWSLKVPTCLNLLNIVIDF